MTARFTSVILLFLLKYCLYVSINEEGMPGDNCSVFGCGSSRKTKGIGIWKLPAPRNAEYKKWRELWLNELTKTRVVDKDFKRQIDNDRVFTCENHFRPEDIEICKYQIQFYKFNYTRSYRLSARCLYA